VNIQAGLGHWQLDDAEVELVRGNEISNLP
jgi:hypothetical protein